MEERGLLSTHKRSRRTSQRIALNWAKEDEERERRGSPVQRPGGCAGLGPFRRAGWPGGRGQEAVQAWGLSGGLAGPEEGV